MSKISNIVKSRLIDGDSLPEWYEKRLEICNKCSFNSLNVENKDKSFLRKGWELLAGVHCTSIKCGCTISEKAKIAEEECDEGFWSKEISETNRKIGIEVISKDMVNFSYLDDNPVLDYGVIKYKSNSTINVQLLSKKYLETVVSSSCGCTTPKLKENDRGYLLNITYDTKRLGAFSKNITITFINKGVQEVLTIKIKGTVTNTI